MPGGNKTERKKKKKLKKLLRIHSWLTAFFEKCAVCFRLSKVLRSPHTALLPSWVFRAMPGRKKKNTTKQKKSQLSVRATQRATVPINRLLKRHLWLISPAVHRLFTRQFIASNKRRHADGHIVDESNVSRLVSSRVVRHALENNSALWLLSLPMLSWCAHFLSLLLSFDWHFLQGVQEC